MKHGFTVLIVLMVLQTLGLCAVGDSDNWPTWRGPDLTGVSRQGNPPAKWSETENVNLKNNHCAKLYLESIGGCPYNDEQPTCAGAGRPIWEMSVKFNVKLLLKKRRY